MTLEKNKISSLISSDIRIFCYEEIDSTNNEAKRKARELLYSPALFVTERQTSGRGRKDHAFYSPKTGLYLTVLLPIQDEIEQIQKITCAAGVAVCGVIESLTGQHPMIKWVNDILIDGKKVCGILTELITDEENLPRAVAVGIGLNLCTEDFPEEFRDRAGNIGEVNKNQLCGEIVRSLLFEYDHLRENHFLKKYTERSLALGKIITYERVGAIHTAKGVSISNNGGLVVEEDGILTTLSSGEISIKL